MQVHFFFFYICVGGCTRGTLQLDAAHCSTLQHTATHCNTLQHTATHCNTLQHTATHCNAIHCNTLQHIQVRRFTQRIYARIAEVESAGVEGSIAHWLQHDLRADAQVFAIFSNMLNCFSNILKENFFFQNYLCADAQILLKTRFFIKYLLCWNI